MATVLVTGFGPFPNAPINPTEQIVRQLARTRKLHGYRIAAHVFTTSYDTVDRELPRLIARHRPRVIVMFGLAASTPHLRVETTAHNEITRNFVDATGRMPAGSMIRPARAATRSGRAPFTRLVNAARAAGVKARPSQDPGRYLCNYVYWRAIEASRMPGGPQRVVFVHVPELRSGKVPGGLIGLHSWVRAARAVVKTVINDLPAH
jgi:pyroglutamyl-peptidase